MSKPLSLRLVAALVFALEACGTPALPASEPVLVRPSGTYPNVCESDDPLMHCDKSDPVVCRSDSDCAAPNCGPCGSGDIITHRDLGMDCVVSMCAPATVCSADHVCKVR